MYSILGLLTGVFLGLAFNTQYYHIENPAQGIVNSICIVLLIITFCSNVYKEVQNDTK